MRRSELDVTFFMSSLGLARGGMVTQAVHLGKGLVERGHRLTVVGGYRPGRATPVELEGLPVRWIRIPCLPAQLPLWRRIARIRPGLPLKLQSLSFTGMCRFHPQARQALTAADITVTFLEVETVRLSRWRAEHGQPNVSYFPGGIDWKWLRRDRSVVRVALSRTMADRYRQGAGLKIDGEIIPGVPEQWLERPYTVRQKARRLIFVGRLEANKGIMELLATFTALAREFPDLELRICGDGPLRGAVASSVARRGLSGRVACLGSVPAARVWQELREADLFVFPSHYESLPMAVLEAQAVGVPVVASDILGIHEGTGNTGRLVPVGEKEAWIAAIRTLLDDRETRQEMSRAGRQRAQQFTWRRAVEALEQYLYLAISRHQQRMSESPGVGG